MQKPVPVRLVFVFKDNTCALFIFDRGAVFGFNKVAWANLFFFVRIGFPVIGRVNLGTLVRL